MHPCVVCPDILTAFISWRLREKSSCQGSDWLTDLVLIDLLHSIRDQKGNISLWDARDVRDENKKMQRPGSPPAPPPPLLHFLRVQQGALHGTNLDMRHLVMASPSGVVVMNFWDGAAGTQEDLAGNYETGESENGDRIVGSKGEIGAQIQKIADFKETLIFK